jgi:hypothetical protein
MPKNKDWKPSLSRKPVQESRAIRRQKHRELSKALWKATQGRPPTVEPPMSKEAVMAERKKPIPEAFTDAD